MTDDDHWPDHPAAAPDPELQRFRELVEGSLDWAWEIDADSRYTYVSPRIRQVLGREPEDVLGKTPFELMHPDEARRVRAEFEEIIAARNSFAMLRNLNVHRDGHVVVLETSGVPVFAADGAYLGYRGIDRDITERSRYEDALRSERNEARELLNVVDVMIVALDRDGTVTRVNRKACEVLECQEADAIGVDWFATFLPVAVRVEVRRTFDRLVLEELPPPERAQNEIVTRTGRERIIAWRNTVLRNPAGEIVGTLSSGEDVTEALRIEEDLRSSRRMLRLVLDAIPVRVFWKNAQSEYLGCNARFAADAGLESPEDIIGRDDYSLSWSAEADLYRRDDRAVIESGRAKINHEEPQSWPDGTKMWLRTSKIPLRDNDGNAVGVLGCYEDITERRAAEDALRRYEHIVSATADLMAFLDREFTHRAVNDTYVQALGMTRDEIVGRTVEAVFGAATFTGVMRSHLDRCLAGEEVAYQTWLAYPALGRRYVDVRYTPFRGRDGSVVGLVVSSRDLTEWKNADDENRRLEAQVLHTQKLESLGVLAGGIAHDFNNLLTGVLGNAGLALRGLPVDSPARRHLEDIEKASLRAADLCRQMLAYSGRGRFQVQPLDLTEVVEDISDLLEVSVSKSAILRRRFRQDLPAVEADPTQIRQVVMNLITNASDAIGDQPGVITLDTGTMQCDRPYLRETYLDENLPEGSYVYVEVADTGCGMDRETLDRLFDPFYTTKFTGRGLGMAALLGIVRGHHGAVKVFSEPGRGTTVRVLFPASAKPAARVHPEPPSARDWRGSGTVLVVDDEVTVRALATTVLEGAGFVVLTAADGRAAIETFRAHADRVVAVLLDLTMPRMSGEEALRELRGIRPDIAIILSSGYNEQEVTRRFAGGDLAGFVQKPYRPDELIGALRRVLGDG